jgi:hypothetical protein
LNPVKCGSRSWCAYLTNYDGIVKCNTVHVAGEVHHHMDDYGSEMEQLGTIFKTNTGLTKIHISIPIISNTVRKQHLLESLRDNMTLLELHTKRLPSKMGIHPLVEEEEEEEEDELVHISANAYPSLIYSSLV